MEVMARLDAERRLREAEESLKRLERAVDPDTDDDNDDGGGGGDRRDSYEVKQEMISDVRTLKSMSHAHIGVYFIIFFLLIYEGCFSENDV